MEHKYGEDNRLDLAAIGSFGWMVKELLGLAGWELSARRAAE